MDKESLDRAVGNKRQVSRQLRQAVLQIHRFRCFWCNDQRADADSVDHFFPLTLGRDRKRLAAALALFDVRMPFDLNAAENLGPLHAKCNRDKGASVPDAVPMFRARLLELLQRATEVRYLESQLKTDRTVTKAVDVVLGQIENGLLKQAHVRMLQSALLTRQQDTDAPVDPDFEAAASELRVEVGDRWKVVGTTGDGVNIVTDGLRHGLMSAAVDPDWSWTCPSCGAHGPWNGNMCLSCGRLSVPGD